MPLVQSRRLANIPAPTGYRWASGGGANLGDCNGLHLSKGGIRGMLCGRYGPHTPSPVNAGNRICGSCARIAHVPRVVEAA